MDGTLVGASGVVHPRIWDAAKAARARGIRLALCSGRPAFCVARDYAARLDPDGWHVFQNGASIVHLPGSHSDSTPIPASWVQRLIAQARSGTRILELYSDDDFVCESPDAWAREHATLLGMPFRPRPLDSLAGPVVRAQWLLSEPDARQLMSESHPGLEMAQSTSPLMPDTRFVGLTHQGVSKGVALSTVAREYQIDLQNVMYVGDAGNDLSALEIVGHPVAMANADAAVLRAARAVAGQVDDGGLAEALEIAVRSH